ncbi:hypothetical protein KUC_1296 [Vreelandella boliviensis LC1]|uniref:Uncharacterized protein n=1 Tax=Vreelandella boliviensis LC1 TaxID=1072583 RepID=A0A7U9C360_9GAMM|nr:hypothetical protein KUC_1296 [Halomonas boliviensis LC1]
MWRVSLQDPHSTNLDPCQPFIGCFLPLLKDNHSVKPIY